MNQSIQTISNLEAYQPRHIRPIALKTINSWALKLYVISKQNDFVDHAAIESGLDYATRNLPWPTTNPLASKHGFITVHFGDSIWILFDLWMDDIVRHFVFRADNVPNPNFTKGPDDGTSACVWELEITQHERNAWVDSVLSRPENPDYSSYLENTLKVRA